MFNPFFHEPIQMLEKQTGSPQFNPANMIMQRISQLDGDDLLILLLIFLIFKDGKKDNVWPIIAALVYCML